MLSMAAGLCAMLLPEHVFTKQMRFLLSLLFVTALAAPFCEMKKSGLAISELLDMTEDTMALRTEQLQEECMAQVQNQTESVIEQMLSAEGILCEEVKAIVHMDEENRIYISEVSVQCGDAQRAETLLKSAFGEEVVIDAAELAENPAS